MHHIFISMFALSLVSGCRGCSEADRQSSGTGSPKREQQKDQAQLRSRLAARMLDRNKTYPKGDDGLVACGKDVDCFLSQGINCTPAVVAHTDKVSSYGLHERIEARYRIVGNDDDKCKLERDTLVLDAKLDPALADALKRQGKTDEDLQQVRMDAIETLRTSNPPRFECKLTADQMLEVGLGLAEGLYDPQFWRLVCSEAELPVHKL
jgi:hypothetical protein